jgi:alkanesulfonate monooxygenase SsuD/methylene tetrahydromethanopterin reductase-like flavin-dependent oxidoreductase (luciferase family)
VRGSPGKLPPPVADIERTWSPAEKAQVARMLTYSLVGDAATVGRGLARFMEETRVDEVMAVGAIFDHQARLRSYEILAEIVRAPSPAVAAAATA